ncbi:MAG: T9SS type A sorting domain-containing protein [Rhodothermaceae bacterium]|nr:T9SS type A sorting domain-containing protein [Rhodothermaceae bacterium]
MRNASASDYYLTTVSIEAPLANQLLPASHSMSPKLCTLFIFLLALVFQAQAQPQIDWVHHVSALDTTSAGSLGIIDADVDVNGNLLLTGSIQEAFDMDSDRIEDLSLRGRYDLFVASYSKDGALNWVRTVGADSIAVGMAITSDDVGNVYINGKGHNLSDIDQDGSADFQSNYTGTFLAKYNAAGALQWVQPHASPMDHPSELLFNEQTNEVLASGADYTLCEENEDPRECFLYGLYAQFNLISYSLDGQINWTRTGNTEPSDSISYIDIHRLGISEQGNLQIGGLVRGTVDIDHTDALPELTGSTFTSTGGNVYWASLSTDGSVLDQNLFGLPLIFLPGIDFTPNGSVYISTGIISGLQADASLPRGHLLHLNEDSSPRWAHLFSSVDSTGFTSLSLQIDTDVASNVYLTGLLNGSGDLDGDGMRDITHAPASTHAFFGKYQPSGSLDWVHIVDHEPFTNSSSQGQWFVTRDGSSIYAIAVFQGTADPDGPGPMPPIAATGIGSGLADMLIMHLSDPTTNTAIEDIASTESALLSSPFPNPFSTQASFTLNVPKTQHVRVDLYNAIGQHIYTLFDAMAYSNSSQEIFLRKTSLPSGLYIIQATGQDFLSTKKLLKVK